MEKQYHNFYAPAFEVLVTGKNILKEGMEVTAVKVENTVKAADSFSFTINNAFDTIKKDFNWLEEFLTVGKKVEIKMGYTDRLKSVVFGPITAIDFSFPAGGFPTVEVRGLDISHLMMKGSKCISWDEVKDSEVANKIAAKYTLDSVEIEETRLKYPKTMQDGESDFRFLSRLAARNGFEFYVLGKTLYFRDPSKKQQELLTLEWGKNLLSFSPRINIAGQVAGVEVRSWDDKAKQVIVGKAGRGDEAGLGGGSKSGGEIVGELFGSQLVEHLSCTVRSQEEAELKAKTEYNKLASKLLTGNGEALGIPEIMPGGYIRLEGLGKTFSRTYYISGTQHTISSLGYRTSFKVEGNKI